MLVLHNSLNQFPIDGHLGCPKSFAVTNCVAVCNLAPTSFPTCVSVFAAESPRSSSVVIVIAIAKVTSTEVVPIYIPVVLPD